MENIIDWHKKTTVEWTLLRSDGKAFSASAYGLCLFLLTGRGRTAIKRFTVNGTNLNVLKFDFDNNQLPFPGWYSLHLDIIKDGRKVGEARQINAFHVCPCSDGMPNCGCEVQRVCLTSQVTLNHECCSGGNILYPQFVVKDDMHLYLVGDTEAMAESFSLDSLNGHLIYNQ